VRESIFNVLESHMAKNDLTFEDLSVLDAFAGSGALGFEALSRGVAHVTFFEQAPPALKVLQENAAYLNLKRTNVKILRLDATNPQKASNPAGLVFLDPPYGKDLLKPTYEALCKMGWIGPETLTILESALKDPLDPLLMTKALSTRAYGSTVVTLLRG
jgi:16S rRNA (guanine966-N2)-methyltransferase